MKLTFLGVSSALTMGYKQFQSNMILTSSSGLNLLIDCGTDIRHSLYEQHLTHTDINAVYISHLHSDHVGGLEWLGFSSFFMEHIKLKLYINKDLQEPLWNNVLKGGMSTLEKEAATLESYFNVQPVQDLSFIWENYHFQLIKVFHSINNKEHLPCYGLIISGDKLKVFLSTDTRFSPRELMPIYKKVDLIFHDCELSDMPSGQHAKYSELQTLDKSIKEKMWLYDYNKKFLPKTIGHEFKGFVRQGQVFEI